MGNLWGDLWRSILGDLWGDVLGGPGAVLVVGWKLLLSFVIVWLQPQ